MGGISFGTNYPWLPMGEGRDGQPGASRRLMGMLLDDGFGATYFLTDHLALLSKALAML